MDRIYPLLHNIINYYPYFSEFYSSTNFSYPNWLNQVLGLFKQFGQYPDRDFQFTLQLSCDGPEYINDAGRGEGTTKKCLENFNKLVNALENNLPENVELDIAIKATMDLVNLKKINTKEKIIEYYKFFEDNFICPIVNLGFSNVSINFPVPNFAVPAPATKEDGIYFANYCKMCREIESENHFKYYTDITMFSKKDSFHHNNSYHQGYNFCGTGSGLIGFLPDNMFSACHEGFVHFVEKYKEYVKISNRAEKGTINFDEFAGDREIRFCLNEQQYLDYEKQIYPNNIPEASAYKATIVSEIILLAMAGQIEPKYMFPEYAVKAAAFHLLGAPCVKDNYNVTGSITLSDYGLMKLFFNGAFEYIIQGKEEEYDSSNF